jgi:hypothetical protein
MRLMTMYGAAIGCLSLKHCSGAEEMLILYDCNASLDTLQYLANLINSEIPGTTSPESDVHHISPAPTQDDLTLPALVDLDCGAACVRSLPPVPGPDEPSLPSLEADQCKFLQRLSQPTPYAAARLASMPQLISQRVQVIKGAVDGSLSIAIDPLAAAPRSWVSTLAWFLYISLLGLLLSSCYLAVGCFLLGRIIGKGKEEVRILRFALKMVAQEYLCCSYAFLAILLIARFWFWQARRVTLTVGPCKWKLIGCGCLMWPGSRASLNSGPIEDLLGCQVCFKFHVHTQSGVLGHFGGQLQLVAPHC